MTRKRMLFCCTVALGAAAMVALAGFAPDDAEKFLFTDNFNDNSIDPPWDFGSFGGKSVTAANGRLQFSANGATGQLSFAGLVVDPWGANIKRDFQLEVNSVINLSNVTGNKVVFLGFGFANEGDLAEFPNVGTVLGDRRGPHRSRHHGRLDQTRQWRRRRSRRRDRRADVGQNHNRI